MSETTLNTLKINAARLGQRLGENLAEHSRDLGLIDAFANGSATNGGAGKYLENGAVVTTTGVEETKRMLASKRESDRADGLKRVIAMMLKSHPVTEFFPLVTALLTPPTGLPTRSLITLYTHHIFKSNPQLTLLSINAYQKDLSDPNPIVRASAIRTLSGLQAGKGMREIQDLLRVGLLKGSRDGSWYVRKSVAESTAGLLRNEPSLNNFSALKPVVESLMQSVSPLSVGSILNAWEMMFISPYSPWSETKIEDEGWEYIHQGYRRWCHILRDLDIWGQCVLLRVLTFYGRKFFKDPEIHGLDKDAELLLTVSDDLLLSINPAVVNAVVRLYYYLGTKKMAARVIRPIMRLIQTEKNTEILQMLLETCCLLAGEHLELFRPFTAEFFVGVRDSIKIKILRLHMLVACGSLIDSNVLLREFLHYAHDEDPKFSAEAIGALGKCAESIPSIAKECITHLVALIQNAPGDAVVSKTILVLRQLLTNKTFSTADRTELVQKLAVSVTQGQIRDSEARANVFWLLGRYSREGRLAENVALDVLRVCTKGFMDEGLQAKLQLINMATKVCLVVHSINSSYNDKAIELHTHLLNLARYDANYSLRDWGRYLKGLVNSCGITNAQEPQILTVDQVMDIVFASNQTHWEEDRPKRGELGSFELALPKRKFGFSIPLKEYPSQVPPSSVRDSKAVNHIPALRSFGSSGSASKKKTSLPGIAGGSLQQGGRSITPVVLVPEFRSENQDSRKKGKKLVSLDDFYDDEPVLKLVESIQEEKGSAESETEEETESSGSGEEIVAER